MATQVASSLTVCVEVDLGPGADDERDGVGPQAEHEHHDHHVLHRDLGEPRDAWEYEVGLISRQTGCVNFAPKTTY